MNNISKNQLVLASLLMGTAVMLGAFGAHGLKKLLEPKLLETFHTGVRYQVYHALALLLCGILGLHNIKTKRASLCFFIGIIFFSINCYIYALSQVKVFAMIIPIGGASFILGWFILAYSIFKGSK